MPGMRTTGGDLRHRVTIRKPNANQDETGQPIEDWATDGGVIARNVPAAFQAVSGGERTRGIQIEAGETALFSFRYRSDVTTEMRIYKGSEAWNILRAIDPDGKRIRLLCTASRVV